ncbi:unnamed protein product [Ectocarpus sp. 4 AP-2014]
MGRHVQPLGQERWMASDECSEGSWRRSRVCRQVLWCFLLATRSVSMSVRRPLFWCRRLLSLSPGGVSLPIRPQPM